MGCGLLVVPVKFIQARNYTKGRKSPITLVVIHTMEAPETTVTAENIAGWFAGKTAPQASVHYNVDSDSVVQSLLETDTAWHAGPVNGYSVGVEHAGYAKQTPAEWADTFSLATLELSAELVAGICQRHGIPPERVTAEDLVAGRRTGICGHVDVTKGLKSGTHWDPGPHFPWDYYLGRVRDYMGLVPPVKVEISGELWPVVDHTGSRWAVCPLYLAPVGIGAAVDIALRAGCELPSPGLVDAIWRAADLRINAWKIANSSHDGTAKTMNSDAIHAETARRVELEVGTKVFGRDFTLIAGCYKDVVKSEGKVGLYGWHDLAGKPIQTFYAGHALDWKDYSQGLRLVRRV